MDGKVLKGSYLITDENLYREPHKAITLVRAYLVERELILKPEKVENKQTIIKVESQRQTRYTIESETRYYISDLIEPASGFARRIRGYWGVENKVP